MKPLGSARTGLQAAAFFATFLPLTLALAVQASAQTPSGEMLFTQKCGVCHSITPVEGKLGPVLGGVIGRKAGTLPNYVYSPAMKASGITWSPSVLDTYLKGPSMMVPGTKMPMIVPDPAQRAAIAAYLASQSKPAKK